MKGISSLEQLRSVEDKCYLEPTVTATRDIQIVLRAKKIQHAMECHNSTKVYNEGGGGGREGGREGGEGV